MESIDGKLLEAINNSGFKEKLVHNNDRILYKYTNSGYELDLIIMCNYVISIKGLGGFKRQKIFELVRSGKSSDYASNEFKLFIDDMKLYKGEYSITIYLAPTTLEELKNSASIDLTNKECVKDDFISKVKRCYDFEVDRNKIKVDYKSTSRTYK